MFDDDDEGEEKSQGKGGSPEERAIDGDVLLLERWAAGDSAAGQSLIRRLFPTIQRYFKERVCVDDAADLIQETLYECCRARDKFRGESTLRSFVLSIAHHVLLKYFRKKKRKYAPLDPLTHSVAELSGPGVFTAVVMAGDRERLRWAIRQLPIDLHDALEFKYWKGMTATEAASILGLNPNTYKRRVQRARERLRKILGLAGEDDEPSEG
ncbi:MAG: RNA polymerase sigma factor [Myxococcales bacterium]|nr:RNA polymerase sigma factor [Myxococcales bacterium]